MIRNQGPGKTSGVGFEEKFAKALKKIIPVLIIEENSSSFVLSANDVMQSAWRVCAGLAWNGRNGATDVLYRNSMSL